MSNPVIEFQPHNIRIEMPPGTSLIRAALEAGVHVNATCGGEDACDKCRVLIEKRHQEAGSS